ncbi:hypothetical protein DY000_02060077 [Brassica cretica]|uniref:Uncharacterized protein n=1 Tax=Brassica cretica TaxID=69181 RepID=A0ABQ7ANK3_BRACR|nr:hypothetical protein DY000_02060077 [Brassica cretica]
MFTLFLSTDRHSIEECLFQLRKSTEFAGFEGGQSALTRAAYCEEVFSSDRRILWIMGILLRLAKSCGIFSFAHALGGRQPGRDMRPGLRVCRCQSFENLKGSRKVFVWAAFWLVVPDTNQQAFMATSSRVCASGKEILVLALVSDFSAVILFDRLREADFSRIVIPRHRHVLASAMVVLFLASGLERSTSLVHGSEELGRASAGYMIVLRNLRLDS